MSLNPLYAFWRETRNDHFLRTEKGAINMNCKSARLLIQETFQEVALLIGGIIAVHPVEGDVVGSLMNGLEQIRHDALDTIREEDHEPKVGSILGRGAEPHPAVESTAAANKTLKKRRCASCPRPAFPTRINIFRGKCLPPKL